ncbi:hypothetical protein HDV63DRAFT_358049 [Trichoderma sp. SZMC 28014]
MVRGKELSPQQRSQICELHSHGYGYRRIFKLLVESRPRSGAPRKLQVPSRGPRRRKDSSPVLVDDVVPQSYTGLDATLQNVTYHDLLAMVDWSIFPTQQLHPTDGINLDDGAVAQIDATATQMDNSMAQIGSTTPRMNVAAQMHHHMPLMGDPTTLIESTMPRIHNIPPHLDNMAPHINDMIPQIENTHIDDTIAQINSLGADTDLNLTFQDPTYKGISNHDLLALLDWSIVW